jgi:hypothetical protein
MSLFEQAATVKSLVSGTTSNQNGCGTLGLAPRSWSKFSTVNQRSCDGSFGRMAGVSTKTTSELALLRGYHPTKIRFGWHC